MNFQSLWFELKERFPGVILKDGSEWDGKQNKLWTGEGSEMPSGQPAFSLYNNEYHFGVHPQLAIFLQERGFRCEAHDAGTFFIYRA
jgi:hypothetical protein